MKREVPLLMFALAAGLGAQVRFDVPRLGYVHDPEAKAIRLVSGVAGAAAFEGSVDAGGAVERAWISPSGYALTQGKLDSAVRYIDWSRGVKQDLADAVETAAISPNGRYFALLGGTGVEIWDGSGPARLSRFEASGARGVAVSDDGTLALLTTSSGVSIWQQGKLQQIWSGEAIRGADFLPASRDFAAFDGARNKVLAMRAGAITEYDAQSTGATAFALSADGRSVALGGERTIELVDLATGGSRILAVESAVEDIARAGNGDVLRVKFHGDSRAALLEWAGLASPQIEVLVGGGAQ
jgi:hypothetical protein